MFKEKPYHLRWSVVIVFMLFQSSLFSQKSFTLEQCIEYAFANNPILQIVSADTSLSDLDLQRVKGSYIPRADITAAFQYYLAQRNQIIEGGSFFAPDDLPIGEPLAVPSGYNNAWYPNFNLSQLIFDGAYQSSYNLNAQNRILQEQEMWSFRIDLISGIYKAYISCRLFEIQARFLSENIERIDTLTELTKIKYEEGAGIALEVNRVLVTSNRMKSELADVINSFNESLLALQFQMNYLEPDSMILTDAYGIDEIVLNASETMNNLKTSDPNSRIESKIIQTQISLANESISLEKSRYQPSIGAEGSLGFLPASDSFDALFQSERWQPYAYIGLNMYIPVFNGMDVKRAVEQRTIESMQTMHSYTQFINEYENERQTTYFKLKKSVERYSFAEINLRLAENNIDLLEEAFVNGVADNQDMILGENDLYENQARYFNELLLLLLNEIEGTKVLGNFNFRAGIR
ncbi:MAG: TolC family protein [Bacteroidetes bacterium]|nr:TolC family protein [Bacteroidota bacterium]MBP7398117.1 TolC family protein [Chitinophagales bacterium]MBK7110326.1 TolC family protein [Bacteroidota bacterium]MBK8488389.1 TolC family protein [Bacteroidota bacterium]MBK8681847.1 TolC family protein [Bacteroidota bacterium]